MQNPNATGKRMAFVTGASFGIGAATALALARDGFDVAVSATRLENVSATRAKLEALGVRAFPVALDVRSHGSIQEALGRVVDHFGAIDVLVNNAGVPLSKPTLDITPAEWDGVIATNLTGAFFMSQEMGRHWISRGRPGLIINMTSTHGIVAALNRAAYGISKAAVIHMTKVLAIEWAAHKIRVNSIAPGRVETGSPGRAATSADPKFVEAALERIPLRRFCTVEDVAEAARYLASPGAAYITGHTLVLDGGLTAY